MHPKATLALLAFAGSAVASQQVFEQCGGNDFTGETDCVSGSSCQHVNDWYSQCVPESDLEVREEGESSVASCGNANVNQLVGYGAGTTGGGSGSGTTVTSCSAFKTAVANGGVVRVSGILSGCGRVDIPSGTTVIGVGANSGFTGSGLRVRRNNNVIIRNLRMSRPEQGGDLIELEEATRVWVDHCDLFNDGITGDKDYYDGMLDIKRASDLVTVSWTKLHDHWKGSLIGHSDSNGSQDRGKLRVTYHHNHIYNVNSRLPSMRFGTLHVYSSCYENNPTSGINSRMGAQTLVEQSYFSNTKRAIVTNLDSSEDGYATSRNNIFSNSDTIITRTSSLSPPYSYTLDTADCICNQVRSQAGTGVVG